MKKSIISQREIKNHEAIMGVDIRESIFNFLQAKYPEFNIDTYISLDELNTARREYVSSLIATEKGELKKLDSDVLFAIQNNSILSENLETEIDTPLNFGDRLSDKIATFGGSWKFIIFFFSFILVWMCINIFVLATKPFDPYPFILLNLILSCIAAIQAPIIMMSQNRQEEKDRIRANHDYKINLKAELEIKLLSEKIDHLLVHQNKKLLEIQEIQADFLEDLIKKVGLGNKD